MQPEEALTAVAVHVDARMTAAEAGTMPPPVHPRADADRWFVEEVVPNREVWVAEQGGRLVGLLVLDTAFLDQLYVRPSHWRQGIGAALLHLAMALRPEGFDLWVFEVNQPARTLYEGSGLVAVEHGDGSGNEEQAPDVRYEWRPSRVGPGVGPLRHSDGK